jgi:hypothetical protein
MVSKRQHFSPDGKLLVLPDPTVPRTGKGVDPRPVIVCELKTGRWAKTRISVDLRYAAIDSTGKLLLAMDGQSYSLATGQPARRFGYSGLVRAANPAAPIVAYDTGVERRPPPWRVSLWNLRDNKLLAAVPHNENFKYSSYVEPVWTRDGTYLYFGDAVGEKFTYSREVVEKRKFVVRAWNVQTGKLVAELPWTGWMHPGPRAGTMILTDPSEDEKLRQFLHDAATGATAELPVQIIDAGGDKVAYFNRINRKPHVCVATLHWGDGPSVATRPAPATSRPSTTKLTPRKTIRSSP